MHPTGSAASHDGRSTWGSHGSRQTGGPAIRCRQHGRMARARHRPGGSPCTGGPAIRYRQHGRKQPHNTNRHPFNRCNLATPGEKPALPPAATESRWERRAAPAPDAVVVAQAVGRSEAVRKNLGEAAGMALLWGMVVGGFGLTVVDAEDAFWPAAALVVAIAATITVVVFVVRSVGWPETTQVEVHPHKIVKRRCSGGAEAPPASPSVSTRSRRSMWTTKTVGNS